MSGISALISIAVVVTVSFGTLAVHAAPDAVPFEYAPLAHFGLRVDRTSGGNVCTVSSGDSCQRGVQSSGSGGFMYPSSVALNPRTGHLYVADISNDRVQELDGSGGFLVTFGWGVNKTKSGLRNVTQAEKNICTAASGNTCTAGTPGAAAGHISYPGSVAIDPVTGEVYVLEIESGNYRVEKYTAGGHFVWTIGKGVNRNTRGNVCTEREIERSGVRCGAGAEAASESTEHGAFKFAQQFGDLLAAGGPEGLLYVGDEHRVQEFEAGGRWRSEILLASISSAPSSSVTALAVDGKGDVYVVYRTVTTASGERSARTDVVHEFDPHGDQVKEFSIDPRDSSMMVEVTGMAIDLSGRLAVIGLEIGASHVSHFGVVYEGDTGHVVATFVPPADNDGIAFNGEGDLYVTGTDDQEVVMYVPVSIAAFQGFQTSQVWLQDDGQA